MTFTETYLRRALLLAAALLSGTVALAAAPAVDGALRMGKLENGLTYYVRHTSAQPGLAGFYLVQNVGSLLEEDDQRGLAHFLEHMAFNASEHFPGQIDRFFQRNNLPRYNAYTAQDETVYNVDEVPTSDAVLVDSCLLVLRDWCHFLTFPEKGIEKERGIVLEEWRARRDAVARARERIVGALYNGSRYASRETIGDPEVLSTFDRRQLVAYYDRWYRPDLQAVVVVGDVDAARVEAFIRERFADIPAAVAPQPRPTYAIASNAEPSYVQVVDEGLGGVAMEFTQRIAKPATAATPEELIRRITLRELFNRMIASRLARLTAGHDQTLYSAGIEYDELLRNYDGLTISVVPYPNRDFRALYRVCEVWEMVRKLGFTPYEFKQQCSQLLRQADGFEQQLDRIGYDVYATLYQSHYLHSTPIVEPAIRSSLMRKVLGELTVDEVNEWVKSWSQGDSDRVFIVSGNDGDYDYLTLDDILGAEQDARESDLQQPVFVQVPVRLVDFELKPAKIVRERRLAVGNAVEWTFDNGARVCFKQADLGLGRFRLQAVSPGGMSLVADGDIPSASAVGSLAFASGVYNTDRSAMIEMMQHLDIEINVQLQSRRELIVGQALATEADRFFELLYLGLARPRFDEPEFARYVNELRLSLETRRMTDMDRVADTLRRLYAKPSLRAPEVDTAYIARIDRKRVAEIFRKRFCNPGDFVFYIVGDLTEAEVRDYAARYIGTLPRVKGRPEKAAEHPSKRMQESLERVFEVAMPDDKAIVDLTFSNDLRFDRREAAAFWLMGVVLNSRCTDEIRERRGGSYDVNVGTRYNESGDVSESLSVRFETSVSKVDEMKAAVYREIDDMLRDGVTQADVESIVTAQKQRLTAQPRNTDFWVSTLFNYYETGEDRSQADYHRSVLDALTPADVLRVARAFWEDARKVDVVVKAKQTETN